MPFQLKTKPTPAPPRPPQILVVDDARKVRVIAQQALAAYVCEVTEAANGYNALFQMEKSLPDLILLDVSMPVMGGLEMLTLLRSNAALAAIPVIILASPADHGVMAQLTALGTAGTVMKPFTPAALVAHVQRTLRLAPVKGA